MAKKSLEEVKQLIDMGKEKGFLTYEEVNDLLPPDIVSSEQIDDVMSMFGEMEIEIVDSVQKVKIPKVKLGLGNLNFLDRVDYLDLHFTEHAHHIIYLL